MPHIACEPHHIRDAFASGPIRTARNRMNADTPFAQQLHQRSIARQGSRGTPAPLLNLRQQIQQTLLRPPKLAKLIQKQNVHPVSAARLLPPAACLPSPSPEPPVPSPPRAQARTSTRAALASTSTDRRRTSVQSGRPRNRTSRFHRTIAPDPRNATRAGPSSESRCSEPLPQPIPRYRFPTAR